MIKRKKESTRKEAKLIRGQACTRRNQFIAESGTAISRFVIGNVTEATPRAIW